MKLIRSMRSSSIGKKEHIGIHDALVIRSLESPIEMSLVGNRDRDGKRYWSLGMFFQKYVWMHPVVSEPNELKQREELSLDRLPPSVHKTLSNKIENLVEITHFSIRHLIRRESSPPVKEVIQTSRLQQCGLQATSAEQYVTIEIPQELIREYLSQGYTHLHLGAIRMILTLHGRKGLPVTAKIALLDTTFKEYQHALIGALVSTLTNGSVILTISPDFTIRLTDPTLSQRIRIQIQLIGVTQDASAEQATLHHQVLYRIQDHALDLNLPNTTHDALLMFTDRNHGPAIVNIPRMIPPDELAAIVPLEWITNYERAFPQSTPDVQTTSPPVVTRETDGTVRTVFQRPGTEGRPSFSRQSSSRRIYMISPLTVQHTSNQDDPPIHYYEEGKPVYVSHVNGHFIWDVDHNMCDSDCDCDAWGESEDEDYYKRRSPRRTGSRAVLLLQSSTHQMNLRKHQGFI
ncbi:polyprotein [Arachis hypogaea]|nr:polyprotein [Arachis hypogaea]